jgi:hypothetical protein
MLDEKTTLNPKGRDSSLVRFAMAGEIATAQMVVTSPPRNPTASSAECETNKARAIETDATRNDASYSYNIAERARTLYQASRHGSLLRHAGRAMG